MLKKTNTTYLKSILYLKCLIIYIFDKPVKKTKIDEGNNNMSVVLELFEIRRRKTWNIDNYIECNDLFTLLL